MWISFGLQRPYDFVVPADESVLVNNQSIRSRIAANPFFAGLAADRIDLLAAHAVSRHLGQDDILFRYGDPADRFYVIVSGRISVEVAALEGPSLQLQSLEAGEVLGWSWLIPPYTWSFQARADEDAEVLEFDGREIRAKCESDPQLGFELIKRFSGLMSERLHFARQKMMEEWRPSGFA